MTNGPLAYITRTPTNITLPVLLSSPLILSHVPLYSMQQTVSKSHCSEEMGYFIQPLPGGNLRGLCLTYLQCGTENLERTSEM